MSDVKPDEFLRAIKCGYDDMAEGHRFAYMVGVQTTLNNLGDDDSVEALRESITEYFMDYIDL